MDNKKKRSDSKYLKHHGVEGMHWGERRYQYKDGSLTPEGRAHYGVGDSGDDIWNTDKTGNDMVDSVVDAMKGVLRIYDELENHTVHEENHPDWADDGMGLMWHTIVDRRYDDMPVKSLTELMNDVTREFNAEPASRPPKVYDIGRSRGNSSILTKIKDIFK